MEVEETEDREIIELGDQRREPLKQRLRTLMQLKKMTTKRGEGERGKNYVTAIV